MDNLDRSNRWGMLVNLPTGSVVCVILVSACHNIIDLRIGLNDGIHCAVDLCNSCSIDLAPKRGRFSPVERNEAHRARLTSQSSRQVNSRASRPRRIREIVKSATSGIRGVPERPKLSPILRSRPATTWSDID